MSCDERLQSMTVGHLMSSVTRTSSTASVLNLPRMAVKSLNSADGWPVPIGPNGMRLSWARTCEWLARGYPEARRAATARARRA